MTLKCSPAKCLIVLLIQLLWEGEEEDQSVCVDHYSPHYLQPPIFSQILKVTDTTTIRRQIESDTELSSLH